MSRTLTAQDRSSLIRLASDLPKGSPERKAILAGLAKVAGQKTPVQIVLSSKFPLSTQEVWAQFQSAFNPLMAAEAVGGQDLRNSGWNAMSEEEAFELSAQMQKAYQKQQAALLADLLEGVEKGFLKRLRVHGGGGEWVAA